jgi:hypothetical protein
LTEPLRGFISGAKRRWGKRFDKTWPTLRALDDVVLAGDFAAVPVAVHRHLHGQPALLDAEIAPPGQVRGQRRRGDFAFPGGAFARPLDRGLGYIVVLVRVVPHHIFEQPGRLPLGEGGDFLGVGQVVEVHGGKLPGLVEAI